MYWWLWKKWKMDVISIFLTLRLNNFNKLIIKIILHNNKKIKKILKLINFSKVGIIFF